MNIKTLLGAVLLTALAVTAVSAAPFTPGNVVLCDAAEDRLIEVSLGEEEATVVQVVTWELGDTSRRRPLGVAFDPAGYCYVGITGVPTSATEAVEFPEGRGEIMRIAPDGSMDFFVLPEEVTKGTWVSSYDPHEVYIMSNEPPPPLPSHLFRYQFTGDQISEPTLFEVSNTAQANGNGGYGKALELPDSRIFIPSNTENVINIYDQEGGAPVDSITTEVGYRSLAFIEGTDYLLANPDGTTVDRITFEGEVEGTFDFSLDFMGGVWNFTILRDETERFIVTNHNGPADSNNMVYIYDASDLQNIFPTMLPIVGLSDFGDEDGMATQLFDSAAVPEPVSVSSWSIY